MSPFGRFSYTWTVFDESILDKRTRGLEMVTERKAEGAEGEAALLYMPDRYGTVKLFKLWPNLLRAQTFTQN